ncbi:hypothetical protein [Flavobacterium algicola]|uniref:hypothetical protein n=1 Tax=Flavobacterium algicola TaxID=556529 RepID=UPI001EFDF3E4|nr:hypothetical protein [Flavobacterium algicola]MCG9792996.1 hypothetical protein [Flavobacterium algicola]
MTKKALIKRLKWYYPMERMHAFVTFPTIAIYLIITKSFVDILFLLYGLILCIFILFQGQHYWKLKLDRLTGKSFDLNKNLHFFRKSKKINVLMIALVPFIFIVQVYFGDWSIKTENLILWAGIANVFGILEHINYYHRQLMLDNASDLNYMMRYKRLKIASLAKDLSENKI